VEYCQEDVADFICNSTGDPCDVALICDEVNDVCDVSDVSLIISDNSGTPGTIDIALDNSLDFVGEVHLDICDVDQRIWLLIDTVSCGTTVRSSAFSCAITDLGAGCVQVDLTTISGVIDPGTGAIAQLTYTLDATAPPGESADLNPENVDIRDDSAIPLAVTPVPGSILVPVPSHFSPVAITSTWMDLWGTFMISDIDAEVGDEVGVFVGNDCFGAYEVDTPGFYGFLHVYGDDPITPAKDGADPGDLLTIKIWDSNEEGEHILSTSEYTGPDPLTWTDGASEQVDINAEDHFTPVAQTATWMDLWGTFTIDGFDAKVGDEVGVFVGNDCFGAYKVDTSGFYGFLPVYGNDPVTPAKDGADPGDLLTIKIWDSNEGVEYTLTTADYTGPDPLTWTDGIVEQVDIHATDILASWYNNLYPVNEYICRVEPPDSSDGQSSTDLSSPSSAITMHRAQELVLLETSFEGGS
jgi:hypothetical protein